MNLLSTQHAGPHFRPGRILATPAAVAVLTDAKVSIIDPLCRHGRGDFGELAEPDRQQNKQAIATGHRILSSHVFTGGQTVWLSTDGRSPGYDRPVAGR
ncbi:hypothetical protein [Paraburkholderia sp. B3]|uniref:hypothetical protein n=1 Tax=Paraburkholderia sp. B3 TaxID=3134791 RepID=UPI0039829273